VSGDQGSLRQGIDFDLTGLFQAVVESAVDGVLLVDDEGIILFANPAASRLFRYSPSELIGAPLTMLIPNARNEREPVEYTVVARDGDQLPVELSMTVHVLSGRRIVTVSIRDLRDRKEAELMRALLANRALLRTDVAVALTRRGTTRDMLQRCAEALVDRLGAAFARVWTLDEEHGVLELQASAGQYTHLDGPHSRVALGQLKIGRIAQDRKPMVTKDVSRDPLIADRAWAAREGMVSFAGHPLIVEDRVVGVMALFSRRPLTDGTIDDLAGIADAIAQGIERLRAEAAMQATQAELMRVARIVTMGELLGSIAHEINQPLTSIVINARACRNLLGAPDPPLAEIRRAVGDIAAAGQRAGDVIGRIRALLEKGRAHSEELNINTVVGEVLELTRAAILKNRIVLRTELATAAPTLVADRVQLQQVVLNLVTNAIESMSSSADGPRELTISTHSDGGERVSLQVQDTGIGIDAEHLTRIFDPFFTTKPEGMGMGLSISQTIVKHLGGRLWATPNDDGGATVAFSLPVSSPR
jgi:PAS domain S-box-containing protein